MDFFPEMDTFSSFELGLPSIDLLDIDPPASPLGSSLLSSLSSLPADPMVLQDTARPVEVLSPFSDHVNPKLVRSLAHSPSPSPSAAHVSHFSNGHRHTLDLELDGGDLWATLESSVAAASKENFSASVSPEPTFDGEMRMENSRSQSPNQRTQRKRKRKRSAKEPTPVGISRARKDQLPEDEIERLLSLKPSQLSPEEREIRKRAKNRRSAAVARAKRKMKTSDHSQALASLQSENKALCAKIAALEAENARLRAPDGQPPAKRRCA